MEATFWFSWALFVLLIFLQRFFKFNVDQMGSKLTALYVITVFISGLTAGITFFYVFGL
jgi:hypothetical protein